MKKDIRLNRERKTIKVMVKLYCQVKHGNSSLLCTECQNILDYALTKIDTCCFGKEKPACSKCKIHCYEKIKREKIKTIMKYAGPRMWYRHPHLVILHLIDKFNY